MEGVTLYYNLDYWLMIFVSFHWLIAIIGYKPLYHAKCGKRTRYFWGRLHFYFSLVFYILRAFLIKQLFHSRFKLLDI